MQEKKAKKRLRTSFNFDYDVYNEFREYCKEERVSQVGIIEKLIKKFLEDKKDENR